MTTISPVANGTETSAPPAAVATNAAPQELTQFLSLLTAQVQNQDPMKPLDSTAFVEQLATFSALEQQVQTNTHLGEIVRMLSAE
ncbi:flagellar hook assembly protein FlgD [Parvularcula dongshanensis]|uniref:Basal-body rod modification protein FlgD n=1 Tax=Parvularcula dongshanensis TaxID=1173995 RepID=A0A840I7S3_9PROT|nr:flagellar hook capping FlgD N-terminal domain-containing protein [Parvularcula dongshanensis]MBB4660313.1 flagellar hook assembly protein FlgD [Parvularcula dongshanensis]